MRLMAVGFQVSDVVLGERQVVVESLSPGAAGIDEIGGGRRTAPMLQCR